jgi:hypothetical protein
MQELKTLTRDELKERIDANIAKRNELAAEYQHLKTYCKTRPSSIKLTYTTDKIAELQAWLDELQLNLSK